VDDKDKLKSRQEYEAFWERLTRYSLHRREELREQSDIFRQRAAAFVSWVKLRLSGSQGQEQAQRRQGGLLHRISVYHLFQRQRVHQDSEERVDSEYRIRPWASKQGPDRACNDR
jgi:hypothetical protein